MTTFENRPPSDTPDWTPGPGYTCGGCGATGNLCYVLRGAPVHEPCCNRCSHSVAAEPTVQVWDGDYG